MKCILYVILSILALHTHESTKSEKRFSVYYIGDCILLVFVIFEKKKFLQKFQLPNVTCDLNSIFEKCVLPKLAKKLTHPKHNVRKLYHASLDRKLNLKDLHKLQGDVIIEGRKVFIDAVSYINGESKSEIGIEIHSGRNRIVRKIFEHVGYKVVKLDRVLFAGLTKKNLPRGRWRELTKQELSNLQMI